MRLCKFRIWQIRLKGAWGSYLLGRSYLLAGSYLSKGFLGFSGARVNSFWRQEIDKKDYLRLNESRLYLGEMTVS